MSAQQKDSLLKMGFDEAYIVRASKVYDKNWPSNDGYNIDALTEVIIRLQNKDKAKQNDVAQSVKPVSANHSNTLPPSISVSNSPSMNHNNK